MFSSNRLSFSRSFSSPSNKSLVSALLLLALQKLAEINIPIFAAADAALAVAQVEQREDLLLGNQRLVFDFCLVFLVAGVVALLAGLLSFAVLLRDLETSAEPSAVLPLEHGLVEVLFVRHCLGRRLGVRHLCGRHISNRFPGFPGSDALTR